MKQLLEQAFWIMPVRDLGTVCPEFIRNFAAAKKVRKAELTITAIGVYEVFINGRRVSSAVLAPGCTVFAKRLLCQTYDVTDFLKDENQICIGVGSGWHRGRISVKSPEINTMPCAVLAQLNITDENGRQEILCTDENWNCRESRIRFSDLYDGEVYDASMEEAPLESVKCCPELGKERLVPQDGEWICEHEHILPKAVITTPKGETVLDFGQNFAGYPEITLNAEKGQRVSFSFSEILDHDGNFYNENYRTAQCRYEYICRDGKQTYKPHFTFYGFRYLRLDEYPGEVKPENFTGIAVYSDIRRTGSIQTANEKINQLFSNTLWSQRSNFIDIPTDCPQRDERMGWTGDAQVFCRTASYNYDVKKFYEKWLADVRADQFENGGIPDTVPNYWMMPRSSTAWGDVIAILPWQLYQTYGDAQVLRDNFDAIRRWVDFMTEDSADPYLWTCKAEEKHLWGKHYGDWLAQDAPYGSYIGATDVDFIASAFYIHSIFLLVETGHAIKQNVEKYEELYQHAKKTFRKHFTEYPTQTACVLALHFDLTDDRRGVAAKLAAMIRENGTRMTTGFLGTPYLLSVLTENGYLSLAYDLLLQEAFPSWLYAVNHGATTIWEHWDGVRDDGTIWSKDMNSYNHYAYGCVMDWIYSCAAGISPLSPGYERISIRPLPGKRLGWIDVSFESRKGMIRSKWVCMEDAVRYEITTPTDAVVTIDGISREVGAGTYFFYGKLPE